jgi:hypothetical protein
MSSLDLPYVIDSADVWVSDLTGYSGLIVEAGERLWVEGDGFWEELESDGLVELEVIGLIDLAHSALADEGDNSVTTGEQGARDETAIKALLRR